jgi:hypothetical protein
VIKDFAPKDGQLPENLAQKTIAWQFAVCAEQAGIIEKIFNDVLPLMLTQPGLVEKIDSAIFFKRGKGLIGR